MYWVRKRLGHTNECRIQNLSPGAGYGGRRKKTNKKKKLLKKKSRSSRTLFTWKNDESSLKKGKY